ncbi:MAG: hypothetical protein JXA09_04430 [Anaerolineae bacterium]|nr:hypothetical protein [Anaerolineae bacterium]
MARGLSGRLGPYGRALLAGLVVLVFWAGLARTLEPPYAPTLPHVWGATKQAGAQDVPSAHLEVRNCSSADPALVEEVVARLEDDRRAIVSYLGREMSYRVPVLIVDGSGPALTDGLQLIVYHDEGSVDLATAPVLLAALGEGSLSMPGLSVFLEGAYAVYVAEEAGRTADLLGQSTDTWVAVMRRAGTLLPLSKCLAVGIPRSKAQGADVVRAWLQGASLMRWLSDAYGEGALMALRDGQSLEELTALPIARIEEEWLYSVADPATSLSCMEAAPPASPLRAYCGVLAP